MKTKLLMCLPLLFLPAIFGCSTTPQVFEIKKSDTIHSKPPDADKLVKGLQVPFGIWLNSKQWKWASKDDSNNTIGTSFNQLIDTYGVRGDFTFIFLHSSNEIFGLVIESRKRASKEDIIKYLAKSTSKNKLNITNVEERTVNNNEILFIKYVSTDETKPALGLQYSLSTRKGSMFLIAATVPYLFEEHKNSIYAFLDGLVDLSEPGRFDGVWSGSSTGTPEIGDTGSPCPGTIGFNATITDSQIAGIGNDPKGNQYRVTGYIDSHGNVSAWIVTGEKNVAGITGVFSDKAGHGTFKTIDGCVGTWASTKSN